MMTPMNNNSKFLHMVLQAAKICNLGVWVECLYGVYSSNATISGDGSQRRESFQGFPAFERTIIYPIVSYHAFYIWILTVWALWPQKTVEFLQRTTDNDDVMTQTQLLEDSICSIQCTYEFTIRLRIQGLKCL